MGEEERRSGLEVRRDVGFVDGRLHLVGQEDRDDLGTAYRVGDGRGLQAGVLGRLPRAAALAQPDRDVHA